MKILAIYGSPRRGGNTDTLLDEFLRGAREGGADVTKKRLRDMEIIPCTECGGCDDTGRCIYDDDYQEIYNSLIDIDAIIISSPIFFYGLPAIVKAFIDRSQQYWVRKYKLEGNEVKKRESEKSGYFLSAGATVGKKVFDGPLLNMKYFFDAINFTFEEPLLFRGLDEADAARKHADFLQVCYDAGGKAAKKATA